MSPLLQVREVCFSHSRPARFKRLKKSSSLSRARNSSRSCQASITTLTPYNCLDSTKRPDSSIFHRQGVVSRSAVVDTPTDVCNLTLAAVRGFVGCAMICCIDCTTDIAYSEAWRRNQKRVAATLIELVD